MAYIFLDESGDLGFNFTKSKTSQLFIVTCMFVNDKKPIEKIVKKIFRTFTKKELRSHTGTLHCFKEKPKTREKLLSFLSKQEVSIMTIYLNKKKVYTKLCEEKHILYNYVANILLDRIHAKKLLPFDKLVLLVISRRETNKFLNENFTNYLQNQLFSNHNIKLKIEIKSPFEEKCLQVTDFASWAIFRKREHGDNSYYEIIKSKIKEENPLFP